MTYAERDKHVDMVETIMGYENPVTGLTYFQQELFDTRPSVAQVVSAMVTLRMPVPDVYVSHAVWSFLNDPNVVENWVERWGSEWYLPGPGEPGVYGWQVGGRVKRGLLLIMLDRGWPDEWLVRALRVGLSFDEAYAMTSSDPEWFLVLEAFATGNVFDV